MSFAEGNFALCRLPALAVVVNKSAALPSAVRFAAGRATWFCLTGTALSCAWLVFTGGGCGTLHLFLQLLFFLPQILGVRSLGIWRPACKKVAVSAMGQCTGDSVQVAVSAKGQFYR